MKKLTLIVTGMTLFFLAHSQEFNRWSIDSMSERHDICKTILLFEEIRDTIDIQTHQNYSQRIAYYFDREHKEFRYIDVYNFYKKIKQHKIAKIFRKQKKIPPSIHIRYTFYNDQLVKVKLQHANSYCKKCSGEYYFNNGILITKDEMNVTQQNRNFVTEAKFYLKKAKI